jgi:ribosome-binding protein aMBF1 (putative translation factor)
VGKTKDFLAELIEDSTAEDPLFAVLHRAELERRELMRQLAAKRAELGLSQTELAYRMRTQQPVVSRLLSGDVDPQHSTEDRLAAAMGMRIERRLVPA